MYSFLATLVFGVLLYTFFIVKLTRSLYRIDRGDNKELATVTVVFAAHNERNSIGLCLASLMNQRYPDDKYSVIVADDRSSDGTSEVLVRFQQVWKALRIVRIDEVSEGLSPKKNALMRAIQEAGGDIILQTDADCVVPPRWISGMVRGFDDGVGMVVGVAPYLPEHSFLNSFIRHEYLWNAALAAGSITLGYPSHASGRNLAFRRDMFQEIGGYGKHASVLSGDDTLLLHHMVRHSSYQPRYMPDILTHVFTTAPHGFRAFLRQRMRHMSTGKYFDGMQIVAGIAVYGFHFLLLVAALWGLYSLHVLIVVSGVFLVKSAVDVYLVRATQDTLGLDIQDGSFITNEVYHTIYLALMPVLGTMFPARWKRDS